MQYQLFVQSLSTLDAAEQKFVASVVEMPTVSGEGATEAEAIAQAKVALESKLATGKFVTIQVNSTHQSNESSFLMQYAGIFADDPTFDDWMEKLAQIRREANITVDE